MQPINVIWLIKNHLYFLKKFLSSTWIVVNETLVAAVNHRTAAVKSASLPACYYWLLSANKQLIHIIGFSCAKQTAKWEECLTWA